MNTYDIDGVIYMGPGRDGIYPGPRDIIITGRSYEEKNETVNMLKKKGINNAIYFNPLPFDQKTRESSGHHKSRVLLELLHQGFDINIHFEDDPIQADVIKNLVPSVNVVLLVHDLVEKENARHFE